MHTCIYRCITVIQMGVLHTVGRQRVGRQNRQGVCGPTPCLFCSLARLSPGMLPASAVVKEGTEPAAITAQDFEPPPEGTVLNPDEQEADAARAAAGETLILLHPPLPLVGVSIRMERGCQ